MINIIELITTSKLSILYALIIYDIKYMMRLAVPVKFPEGMASEVFEHFGRCEHFAVFETDNGEPKLVGFIRVEPSSGKRPAAFMIDNRVDVVIASLIGPCEYGILLDNGVRVFKGAEGTIGDAINAYNAGTLIRVEKSRYAL